MLYHISLDPVEKFMLKIPNEIMSDENNTIPRICFSRTKEGAMTAIPCSVNLAAGLLNMKRKLGVIPLMYLYKVDESKIDDKYIIGSGEIKEKYFVKDAEITNEVWVLTDNIDVSCEVVKVEDFYFYIDEVDGKKMYVIDKLIYKKASEEEIRSNNDYWNDIFKSIDISSDKVDLKKIKRIAISKLSGLSKDKYI